MSNDIFKVYYFVNDHGFVSKKFLPYCKVQKFNKCSAEENYIYDPKVEEFKASLGNCCNKCAKYQSNLKEQDCIHSNFKRNFKNLIVLHSGCCNQMSKDILNGLPSRNVQNHTAAFKIFVKGVTLSKKSIQILRAIDVNPHVFLKWRFLGANDVTYTAIQPANKGIFQCSSTYHGCITEELLTCLKESTVNIECYVVLNEKSRVVATGSFDVLPALRRPNRKYKLKNVILVGRKVSAFVNCWCELNCSSAFIKNYLNSGK